MPKNTFEFTYTFNTQVTCKVDVDTNFTVVLDIIRSIKNNPRLDLTNFKKEKLVTVDGIPIGTLPGVTIQFTQVENPNDEEFFTEEYLNGESY